jgi:probable HAF family extracellular repeat protein
MRAIIAAAALCALFLRPAAAQTRTAYEVVDLGTLGGAMSEAYAINDRGQVAGWSLTEAGDSHAFLWREGVMIDLGTLGGKNSSAAALNSRGDVVGESDTKTGAPHAFLWKAGRMLDLGTLGGTWSRAVAINAAGVIAGDSETEGGRIHAFRWSEGKIVDLGTFRGRQSFAYGLSASGDVAGQSETDSGSRHYFLWHDFTTSDLGEVGGDRSAFVQWMMAAESKRNALEWSGVDPRTFMARPERGIPHRINAAGVVCGSAEFGATARPDVGACVHAAIWRPLAEER